MTLLDAYGLIAFLVGGPAARDVRAILREGDAGVATANLAEVLDVSQRVHGLPIDRVRDALEPLFHSALRPIPLDVPVAHRSAEIRSRHYHRSRRPISLADAVLLASAQTQDRIATSDRAVLAVARAEKIEAVALPA